LGAAGVGTAGAAGVDGVADADAGSDVGHLGGGPILPSASVVH